MINFVVLFSLFYLQDPVENKTPSAKNYSYQDDKAEDSAEEVHFEYEENGKIIHLKQMKNMKWKCIFCSIELSQPTFQICKCEDTIKGDENQDKKE